MRTVRFVILAAACSSACASTGYTPRPFPTPGGAAAPAPPVPSRPAPSPAGPESAAPSSPAPRSAAAGVDGYALVGTALALRGAPYRNGGADPTGFDCSGFTQYVFSQYGVSLPRAVKDQFKRGKPVDASHIAAGDLLFFTTTEPGVSHVAIAVGGDEFVHAPSANGIVRVERLGQAYWGQRYISARRVTN